MPDYTLTYDEKVRGWTSFHSYHPDFITNMNNEMFTFKNGDLYIHNVDYGDRNTFYGVPSPTSVTVLANDAPSEVKNFKTLQLESSSKEWDVDIVTDLDVGHINAESFEDKEGFRYAYIRRDEDGTLVPDMLSVQGVGNCNDVTDETISFGVNIPSNINVGDTVYGLIDDSNIKLGTIDSKTHNSITLDELNSTLESGDFIFVAKNKIAESTGLKGYFAEIELKSYSTDPVELYAVNAEATKSFP